MWGEWRDYGGWGEEDFRRVKKVRGEWVRWGIEGGSEVMVWGEMEEEWGYVGGKWGEGWVF